MDNKKLPKLYSTTKCPKCKAVDLPSEIFGYINARFTYRYMDGGPVDHYYGIPAIEHNECIKVQCGHCGYIWYEDCADA